MNNDQKNISLAEIIESHFDFSAYPAEEKESMIAETAGLIMESALLQALGDGGEEVQDKFNNFMDNEPDDIQMNDYIQKELPRFQEYVMQELKALKDLGEVKK